MDFLIFYILCGLFMGAMFYNEIRAAGITGEQILLCFPPRISCWFREHPMAFKLTLIVTFVIGVIAWPYVVYKLTSLNE